ncbi:hypothetical protein [Halomarina litorea]|uniref:hypothetical protein n=1 Tax=Halomarina litorea TaxID=2961595 RepID=UPI0020C35C86|nr:hypothetical protein [Halomarina sp. BCD28]
MNTTRPQAATLARFDPLAFAVFTVLSALALVEVLFGSALLTAASVLLAVGTVAVAVACLTLLPFAVVALAVWVLEG